jgi:leader peptidase (prepilin peptidase)/N-methyltransferase
MSALPDVADLSAIALYLIGWALLGWLAGIVLNRLVHQLPRDYPVRASPICENCGVPIPVFDLPGRPCAGCGQGTGFDRLEWVTALLFAGLAFRFPGSGALVAYSGYTLALLAIAVIDLRHRYVYSVVAYPAIVIAAILSPLLTGLSVLTVLGGIGAGFGIFAGFYLVGRLLYRGTEPIGIGDIEIAALAGAMVGFPRVLSALFLGGIANAIIVLIFVVVHRRGRHDFVPYGPGMCIGTYAAFFMPP